jgi:hypothetical protein
MLRSIQGLRSQLYAMQSTPLIYMVRELFNAPSN